MMTTRKIGQITYTEYIVKAGETTVQQIARDQLHNESRYKEIKQWKNNTFNEITTTLQPGWVLLLPPVAATEAILKFHNTSLGGDPVYSEARSDSSKIIYTAQINTEFQYKKSTLTRDSNGRLWVKLYLRGIPKDIYVLKMERFILQTRS
jgi:hypothetical protein